MSLLDRHLQVKKSSLPGAGKGLFTKVFIPKGTRISEYRGKITNWEEADHDDGNNRYIYYVSEDHVIDANGNKDSFAHYANDAEGYRKVKGIRNNTDYNIVGNRVFIEATRDIPAGGEILVGYGREYWNTLKKYGVL